MKVHKVKYSEQRMFGKKFVITQCGFDLIDPQPKDMETPYKCSKSWDYVTCDYCRKKK